MKRVIEVKNGQIRVKTYNREDRVIAEYEVDLFDTYVRFGLIELGWSPPARAYQGTRSFVREDYAQEIKEEKTESDAGKAVPAKTDRGLGGLVRRAKSRWYPSSSNS